MNLVGGGGPGGKAPGSSWILGLLRLKSIMIMLYINFKFIYYTQIEANIAVCLFFSGQNLSLKISTIQELPVGQTPRRNCLVPPTF
jgi:hypothetical protein